MRSLLEAARYRGISGLTVRIYVAALFAVGAAAFVFWWLERSESTECFYVSVEVSVGERANVPERCDAEAFDAVRRHLKDRRAAVAAGNDEVEEPSEVRARSALLAWMALLAVTAGFAAVVLVQSGAIIWELWPGLSSALVVKFLPVLVTAVTPFFLLDSFEVDLGPYDDLHLREIGLLPPAIVVLVLPAAFGLVVIGHIISTDRGLNLNRIAYLGSRMRQLIGMLGATLALGVLTTASRWQVIDALPGGESLPSTIILLWGSLFALALGVLYVPVHHLWATEAEREVSEEVKRQLPDQRRLGGTAGFRVSELSIKRDLYASLGVGGALTSLRGSLAVLAPVVAAAISSLFS